VHRYRDRVAALRALIDEVAPVAWSDPRWWVLVATAAAAETRRAPPAYLLSDAGADADTLMAWPAPAPRGPAAAIAEAIALARAASSAVGELDGTLEDQPLAGTIALAAGGARFAPGAIDAVAFAVGARVAVAPLAATDAALAGALAALARGELIAPLVPLAARAAFACVAVGDDAWPTARHGHRRAWTAAGGPWLGLARTGDHLLASTSHYAIDGFGHGLLAARVAGAIARAPAVAAAGHAPALPPLAAVAGVAPLAVASRAWPAPVSAPATAQPEPPDDGTTRGTSVPRAVDLAYRFGVILGDELGVRGAMTPTIQIPLAPGDRADPARVRRRVIPALVSVRWTSAGPEPATTFAERAGRAIAREAARAGLASRVYAAGRALPLPLHWKRRVAADGRPALFAPLHDVIAGRGCVSVIALPPDANAPPLCAVSAPARRDPIGSTVITVVGDAAGAATITVTGTGRWGTDAACAALLDRLQ
jgi:hypothetical protein